MALMHVLTAINSTIVSLCYFDIIHATADELVNDASKDLPHQHG